MKKSLVVAGMGLALLLSACGDKQEASKGNFKDAIEHYAKDSGVCLPLALNVSTQEVREGNVVGRYAMLGMEQVTLETQDVSGNEINEVALKQMDVLVDAGLYQKNKNLSNDKQEVFDITKKGIDNTRLGEHGPLFCIGTQRVAKVLWYTEPATNAQGLTVASVVYEADTKLDDWAERLLRRGSADWKEGLETSRTQQAVLVKTNDGWRDVRELPQPDAPLPR